MSLGRFWSRVQKTESCWIWTGGKRRKGYGVLHWNGKGQSAHRIAYELAHGPVPQGMHVLHSCDTPACVRPDHLRAGTNKENHEERSRKGRSAKGEGCGRATIGFDDVRAIRAARIAGVGLAALGSVYGLTPGHIRDIASGRRWGQVAK